MPQDFAKESVVVFLTIMAVILISPLLTERVRLSSIVGLIVGGILVGPHGLDWLKNGQAMGIFSSVGLIYLMFNAGLEIDLNQFNRVKMKSLLFAVLTFSLPEASGIILGRVWGQSWAASILLGSIYASHTLVAYPILSRMNILSNEAVSVTIGATVFTDISALLILAVVVGQSQDNNSIAHIVQIVLLMIGYAVLILIGIPRLGKIFFSRITNRAIEFQFVLVVLFLSALLAEQIGMHAIVGAFLAGLAINETLPPRSRVVSQVLFLGESFFIPVFLIYVGMIIDPGAIIVNVQTLVVGILLSIAVYITKFAAAWLTGTLFHYSPEERFTMFGLSQAQAAATLATVLVGVQAKIFPQSFFNSVILTILLTTITSPWIVQHFGARLLPSSKVGEQKPLFNRILVPIANPQTQEHLINLASMLARSVDGTLLPLNVALEDQGRVRGLDQQQALFESDILKEPDITVQPVRRVDSSISKGIVRTAIEQETSLILIGWSGRTTLRKNIFGTLVDEVIWNAPSPVLVGKLQNPVNTLERVLFVLPPSYSAKNRLRKIVELTAAITLAFDVPLRVFAPSRALTDLKSCFEEADADLATDMEGISPTSRVLQEVKENDLVVIPGTVSHRRFRSWLGAIPEKLAASQRGSLLVVHFTD